MTYGYTSPGCAWLKKDFAASEFGRQTESKSVSVANMQCSMTFMTDWHIEVITGT